MKSKFVLLIALGLLGTLLFFLVPTAKADEGEVVVYSEGFESDDGGYTHTGDFNLWQWGTPTWGPGSAHSGSKCWATSLNEDVPRYVDMNEYLTSPAIPVPALGPNEITRIRFFGWIQIDEMFDRGEFQVSATGSNWETKAEFFYIMQGCWTEYYFDISDYAGGYIYLRFKLYVDSQEAFWIEKGAPPPYSSINMAGWYIDDLAIITTTTPTIKTTLTLEAFEDQYMYASCPWVYTWNSEEYMKDNDVYSTARGETKEFTDYYTLNNPLVSENGQYLLELRETEDESSYTDLVQLMTIDHESGVEIAADDNGDIRTYISPSQPDSAIDDEGNDVLSQISAEDDEGFQGYNNDYIVLDFSSLDITNGATFVLKVQGFLVDSETGPGESTLNRPWVHVQTQDANGDWVTRNEFYPRWEWSTSAYDLSGYLTTSQMVRLYITSCHKGKYHVIDYAGLDTAPQSSTTVNILSATSAIHSINGDVLDLISSSDDIYASMSPMESIAFTFDVPDLAGEVRDFVFISEGYYVPLGTFFIYTWDGTGWAQRDAWSIEGFGDMTKDFDLSLWLPDPDGEYKVRIWQDYWYNDARIDYVGLTQVSPIYGTVVGVIDTAEDLRTVANRPGIPYEPRIITPWIPELVKERISASDNQYLLYPQEPPQNYYGPPWPGFSGYIQRDRWLEVKWTGLAVNTPPTTFPVIITDETSPTPTISWTYNDVDADPQIQYEVEVWTGSGGTGLNVWDPAVGTGAVTSVVYTGSALIRGTTYYARVKAYDGTNWGAWSEASWTYPTNQPPLANANGPYTINEGELLVLDASGSSDPDGDPLTYSWDLDNDAVYGDVIGVTPTIDWTTLVSYGLGDDGIYTIGLETTDIYGAVDTDSSTVTINNVAPLPTILGPLEVDEDDPFSFSGTFTDPGTLDTHTIWWEFNEGAGFTELNTLTPIYTYENPGDYFVRLKVVDDDGGIGITDPFTITVLDKTPPETTLTLGCHYTDEFGTTYVTSSTIFTLEATDEFSDIAYTKYIIKGVEFDYTEPFTLSGPDGIYLVSFYSADTAGNVETPQEPLEFYLVNLKASSWLTDSDFNPISYFDFIFRKDNQLGGYTLVATNPGQFYYHIEVLNNWPITVDTLIIEANLPEPFILKGAMPIHVYLDGVDITESCTINGAVVEILNVPLGSTVYITIHMDYGYKGSNWASLSDFILASYKFNTEVTAPPGDGLCAYYQSSSYLYGHQKKTTGICGFVTDIDGNPRVGVVVYLCSEDGLTIIDSTVTDTNGFYYFIDMELPAYKIVIGPLNDPIIAIDVTVKKDDFVEINLSYSDI
ncbi:MAG: PKD domain-containing protein [Candidatus Odinarchaeota archaeon]